MRFLHFGLNQFNMEAFCEKIENNLLESFPEAE